MRKFRRKDGCLLEFVAQTAERVLIKFGIDGFNTTRADWHAKANGLYCVYFIRKEGIINIKKIEINNHYERLYESVQSLSRYRLDITQ